MGLLTAREAEVLLCLAEGNRQKVAASILGIAVPSVKSHLTRMTGKYNLVRTKVSQLVSLAAKDGSLKVTAATPPCSFTPWEKEVLRLIAEGNENIDIAKAMRVKVKTVRSRLERIYQKLGSKNRPHAIWLAHCYGWLE